MSDSQSTPQEYRMPAEWEPHEGTWLQWPHDGPFEGMQMRLDPIWMAMTQALHQHETVHIIVKNEPSQEYLNRQVAYYGLDPGNIDIQVYETDDVWSRDNGPIFVINDRGDLAVSEWNFNGWGGRYPHECDRLVPSRVAKHFKIPLFRATIVLEGGAIEVNGSGTLIATRSSIINPNRNPGKSQKEIEDALRDYLGIKKVIWLSGAPPEFLEKIGDTTDYHVDTAARFVDETTIVYTWTGDQSVPGQIYLQQHLDELRNATTDSGKELTLIPLPLPENRMFSTLEGDSIYQGRYEIGVASYVNYYVANNLVLVPVYGDVNDAHANSILRELFPEREIIGIPAQHLAELGGMIHCVTQQQPASN